MLWVVLILLLQPLNVCPFCLISTNNPSLQLQKRLLLSPNRKKIVFASTTSFSSTESNSEFSLDQNEIQSIPDEDTISPALHTRPLSERVAMTVSNIRRRRIIFEKYSEDVQGKTGLGAIAALNYIDNLVKTRAGVWGDLVMIVMKRKPKEIEKIVLRAAREVLTAPIDSKEWEWFRDNLLSSFVWFAPSSLNPGTYIYEQLLQIAVDNIQIQASQVDKLRYPALEAVASRVFLGGSEEDCRQDHPWVGQRVDLAPAVARVLSSEDRQFYDLNVHLNKLVCAARVVDPDFQAAVTAVFRDLDPPPRLQPARPKSLTRARAKAQGDYSGRAWPTSSQLVDLVRCSASFRSPDHLLAGLSRLLALAPPDHLSPVAAAPSVGLAVARVKNGFAAKAGGAPALGYRDVKVSVVARSGTGLRLVGEVALVLDELTAYRDATHELYEILRERPFFRECVRLL